MLDIIYNEYALIYSCMGKKYTIWILSRSLYINPEVMSRALRIMSKNALSIDTLQEINQNCEYPNFL